MKALLGIRADGTIGLIVSSKLDNLTDDDVLEYVRRLGPTGWRNMVVLDNGLTREGSCRLRRVETHITG